MLLEGKRLLVTGVLTRSSIAYGVARIAQEQGAEVLLTSFGRARAVTEHASQHLPHPVDILELDVTSPGDLAAVTQSLRERWGSLDGIVHAIGFAPESCLGDDVLAAQWADVATALEVSAYSLKALAELAAELMPSGGSIVGLDFDASRAWPQYGWMGVAKAALEADGALSGPRSRRRGASESTSSRPARCGRPQRGRSPGSAPSRPCGWSAPPSAGTSKTGTRRPGQSWRC